VLQPPSSRHVALLLPLLATTAFATPAHPVAGDGRGPDRPRNPPATRIDPVALAQLVDSVMRAGMADEHIPGAAVLVLDHGRVVLDRGYGFADVAARRPVDPHATRWPFASVTKVVTATALMQLVERGSVELDADVGRYLKVARLPEGAPITPRHLLTHTDGLDEIPGRRAEPGQPPQPLETFLSSRLARAAAPGQVTRYGSYGMALAGAIVQDVSGLPFAEYVRREIFAPLGMSASTIGTPDAADARVATAYAWADGSLRPVAYERYHTPPTSSLVSTVDDMARFAALHLGAGPPARAARVLAPATVRDMAAQHASVHPGVPGWGYGWQINDANGQRIVEHGGDIGGFASLVTLLPDSQFGVVVVHHLEGSNLRFRLKQAILDRFFADRRRPAAFESARRDLGDFAGTYLANNYCRSCPGAAARAQRFQVTDNHDGSLTLWDTGWRPIGPLLFADDTGRRRIGFMRDTSGRVTALSAGAWRVLERAPRELASR